MPFFVFFMPEYVPLSKIRLSWHSQLTYLTSFRSVVLNTHKLLSAPASVCLCRAIKIPIFCYCRHFYLQLTLQRFYLLTKILVKVKAKGFRLTLILINVLISLTVHAQSGGSGTISGKIVTDGKQAVEYATVRLKGTSYGGHTDMQGIYHITAPAGRYSLVVSAVGYKTVEQTVAIEAGVRQKLNVRMKEDAIQLSEVSVVSAGVSRVKNSAYNAVAVDTRDMLNTTKTLSEALAKTPGLKLRESGGVGSDMNLMLDGFSGKHVKIFIDGVPQEGVGSSFGLNNIPVSFADRIEVYKGVVPVGFGTDAIGGVVNIVTNRKRRSWFLDASYSYGSFNTHKSYINFGQTFKNGFTYEINAFQNYSDNSYRVDAPVLDFGSQSIDTKTLYSVKRFNDTYHNEAVVAKFGLTDKSWADRLMFGFTYSHMYKEIQTGVRQKTVYGQKHRHGYSLMPSIEYSKRDLFVKGLSLVATANYNRNSTTNVDTASYRYNWLGERQRTSSPGEQSYLYSRADNDNWNATLNITYRIARMHTLTFNNVFNAFSRDNTSLLYGREDKDPISKDMRKNIAGLSYRLLPSEKWNISLFGKYYRQYVSGPVAVDENASSYVKTSRTIDSWGYGAAGTCFIVDGLQAKLSYEKACRLPTIEEMFGDEDLESGSVLIRPERSDNVNLSLSWSKSFGSHSLYVEGGLVYRDTRDYIQRSIAELSGNREGAYYENYGKVKTTGFNLSARYTMGRWLSIGGNFTRMDVRDNEKIMVGSTSVANPVYKSRMPNVPWQFADADVNFYWHDLLKEGNMLTVTYDNQYLHSFCYYSEGVQAVNLSDYMVPTQFSHNLTLTYSMCRGRYNVSLECRNFTNEKLYDNFSLQKAGRAFYGKVRIYLGR